MDEYVIMNKTDLTTMANTIRETLGSTDSIAVGDLANKLIESIEAGGGGGTDFSPFSSAKFGTFTIPAYSTRTVTIEGISSCKIFAMRRVNVGGVYDEGTNNIVSSVVVNTDTWESYTGVSLFFNVKPLQTSYSRTPTLSEDTLTFSYDLTGTYEYVLVS